MKKIITSIAILSAALVRIASAQETTKLITGIGADSSGSVSNLGTYIVNIYKWGIGLAALFALAFLVFGAIQKILSAGSLASTESANERISAAIYGLILLLAAVTILYSINSRITDLSGPDINKITQDARNRVALEGQIANAQSQLRSVNTSLENLDREKRNAQYARNNPTASAAVDAVVNDILSDLGSDPKNPSASDIQIAKNNLSRLNREIGQMTTADIWIKNLGIDKIDLPTYFANHPTIKYNPKYTDEFYRDSIALDIFTAALIEIQGKTSSAAFQEMVVNNPQINAGFMVARGQEINTLTALRTELEKKLADLQAKL